MLNRILALATVVKLMACTLYGQEVETGYIADGVSPVIRAPVLPRLSDVPMRNLLPRPADNRDSHDTIAAIKDFHVTRLEWTYQLNAPFVKMLAKLRIDAGGAINPVASLAGSWRERRRIKAAAMQKRDGGYARAPWMRTWRPRVLWMCMNNPITRQITDERLQALAELGVKYVQFDDPAGNTRGIRWNACFCRFCMKKFSRFLTRHGRPLLKRGREINRGVYRRIQKRGGAPKRELEKTFARFQEISTSRFHRGWQKRIRRITKQRIATSCNNSARNFRGLYEGFDFWIGELAYADATPPRLHVISRQVASFGKLQVLTMPLHKDVHSDMNWKDVARRALSTAYATGMQMEAPWDVYLPTPDAKRFFGNAGDFADLYGMVRACSHYLDGYEEAFAIGSGIPEAGDVPIRASGGWIFVRVKPKIRNAPVVVHVVFPPEASDYIEIKVDRERIFGGSPLEFTYIQPKPYNQAEHQRAAQTGKFSSLIQVMPLSATQDGRISVPAANPWGLLIIRPSFEHQ